jgi:hypothetical protein
VATQDVLNERDYDSDGGDTGAVNQATQSRASGADSDGVSGDPDEPGEHESDGVVLDVGGGDQYRDGLSAPPPSLVLLTSMAAVSYPARDRGQTPFFTVFHLAFAAVTRHPSVGAL